MDTSAIAARPQGLISSISFVAPSYHNKSYLGITVFSWQIRRSWHNSSEDGAIEVFAPNQANLVSTRPPWHFLLDSQYYLVGLGRMAYVFNLVSHGFDIMRNVRWIPVWLATHQDIFVSTVSLWKDPYLHTWSHTGRRRSLLCARLQLYAKYCMGCYCRLDPCAPSIFHGMCLDGNNCRNPLWLAVFQVDIPVFLSIRDGFQCRRGGNYHRQFYKW